MFLFKFINDNKNIKFYKNKNNDVALYYNFSSIIELKGNNHNILYIPNNFFQENNYAYTSKKERSFNLIAIIKRILSSRNFTPPLRFVISSSIFMEV